MYTAIKLLLFICPFFFPFSFSPNFQTLKFFVTLFSGTVRPRRLKLGTHMDSGQIYHVHRNQAAAAYSSLYFFIFLSNFQTLKFFVTLFSGTVRPRRLKLGTHMDSGQMYLVYETQAAAVDSSLYICSFLSNFQTLKIFGALFSGTVRPIKLKLDKHVDIGWVYCAYRSQAATSYLSLIFLSLQYSKMKNFRHTFLRNCEA